MAARLKRTFVTSIWGRPWPIRLGTLALDETMLEVGFDELRREAFEPR